MNNYIEQSTAKRAKERDITFHYTNEQLVKDLIETIPIESGDTLLDAGSGKNKVFFNNFPKENKKYECEIEDGVDFLDWNERVSWTIGNPPFSLGWKFLEKASMISDKGIAFLGNINFFNCLSQKRLQELKDRGFYINHIHIVSDARWYGRYFFIIFQKNKNDLFSWKRETYK